jgi:hypothetical protein
MIENYVIRKNIILDFIPNETSNFFMNETRIGMKSIYSGNRLMVLSIRSGFLIKFFKGSEYLA